ncbi:serine hydrolase [Paraflavisolibacter sp. H34]|uniref:serine hydrolase domain-containing protein n=1 Tax=Huijunlia imazamoxiresistens TaxID=3127457 RepID=UPI00301B2CBD
MKPLKALKYLLVSVLLLLLGWSIRYCWQSFPIAAGFGAKVVCSGVFLSGRQADEIIAHDLSFAPLNLLNCRVDDADSSVTCTMLGFTPRKAIYRQGLGATLLSELPEEEVRAQRFRMAVPPLPSSDSLPWPAGEGAPPPAENRPLQAALDSFFVEKDPEHPVYTRAVVVIHEGRLVAEKYAPGFTKDSRLPGWSMTKTITGTLAGILVGQKKLAVDDPAPVPEWAAAGDPRHAITLKHLLQQTSGLDFEEEYSRNSDATRMLFRRADMGGYTAAHPLKEPPGSRFYYSSGNSNILSRIIRQTVGEQAYHAFPYEQLFYKLGMYHTVLEPDPSGTYVGSSYGFASARDWARLGLLYLNDGLWNNERILPEGWVQQAVTPAPAAPQGEYGFQLWLNRGGRGTDRLFPKLPADLYFADGFRGQNVFIFPSQRLIVVRLGLARNPDADMERYLSHLLRAAR